MKKRINGALYNTDTAKLLASYGNYNTVPYGNFGWFCEDLYRTKSGKYFLHGQGGANTKYGKHLGSGSYCGGEQIIPLTERGARRWALNAVLDHYETIFGEQKPQDLLDEIQREKEEEEAWLLG